MGISLPPDRIGDVVRQYFTGLQVPDTAPDATATARGGVPRAPGASIGPAAPRYAQPVGGVMGALLNAGQTVDRGMRHPLQAAGELSGVTPLMQGVQNGDLGSLVRGALALAPMMGAFRGAGALADAAPVAAEAAAGGGMSEAELQHWRAIEGFLNGQNADNRGARAAREMTAMTRAMPRVPTPPNPMQAVSDMEIPARGGGLKLLP